MLIDVPNNRIAFIIHNRDRLTSLQKMIAWVSSVNTVPVQIVILDNGSSYEPLLEYYNRLEKLYDNLKIVRLPSDFGQFVIQNFTISGNCPYFVYTDPDSIPCDTCPSDLINHMISVFDENGGIEKVGLSLKFDDILEDFPLKSSIVFSQSIFWKYENESKTAYLGDVGTEFVLCRKNSNIKSRRGNLRTKEPYVGNYFLWQLDLNNIPRDVKFFFDNAKKTSSLCRQVQKFVSEHIIINMDESLEVNPLYPLTKIKSVNNQDISDLIGKTFTYRTDISQTTITFVELNKCIAWDSIAGEVTPIGNRIKIVWKDKRSVDVLNFDRDFTRFTGKSQKEGSISGKLIDPAKPVKIIPSIIRKHQKSAQLSVVVSAYSIERSRIEDFISWNKESFETEQVHLYIVTDRFESFDEEWVHVLVYPYHQKTFSIPKTVNFGIRRAVHGSIIVKTDIDIVFSRMSLRYLKDSVSHRNGTVLMCSDLRDISDVKNSYCSWKSLPKNPEAKGACFALSREDWFDLKGYDERIFGWGADDTEMFYRASRRISLRVNSAYPVFHIAHTKRITSGSGSFFEKRSKKNLSISRNHDWNSPDWGLADCDSVGKCFNISKANQLNFVLAITTYNRCRYLRDCISTWNNTKSCDVYWRLIVADDGSTDSTLDYLSNLQINDTPIDIIKNRRDGVHHQTNTILNMLNSSEFDVCFKVDDDVYFEHPGWDMLYYKSMMNSGYEHLCLYDPTWKHPKNKVDRQILVGLTTPTSVMGCFFTITQNIINKVGFFDTKQFGKSGLGHTDYTARCCRAGFNEYSAPLDVKGSYKFIRLQSRENYHPAVSMVVRNKENTEDVIQRKISLVQQSSRTYIPYWDPNE